MNLGDFGVSEFDNENSLFSSSKSKQNQAALSKKRKANKISNEQDNKIERDEVERAMIESITIAKAELLPRSDDTDSDSDSLQFSILQNKFLEFGLCVVTNLFSPDAITTHLTPAASFYLKILEDQLSAKKIIYKSNSTNNFSHFAFREVAGRQYGRIDSRVGLPTPEDPTVMFGPKHLSAPPFPLEQILSPFLTSTINSLLGGTAALTYAGLIYSFPGSQDQDFHQDGVPLFPEEDIDLPPYALNVFIPLHKLKKTHGLVSYLPNSFYFTSKSISLTHVTDRVLPPFEPASHCQRFEQFGSFQGEFKNRKNNPATSQRG